MSLRDTAKGMAQDAAREGVRGAGKILRDLFLWQREKPREAAAWLDAKAEAMPKRRRWAKARLRRRASALRIYARTLEGLKQKEQCQ